MSSESVNQEAVDRLSRAIEFCAASIAGTGDLAREYDVDAVVQWAQKTVTLGEARELLSEPFPPTTGGAQS